MLSCCQIKEIAYRGNLRDYIMKVDRLEEITGYDFFPEVDDSIENRLESLIPSIWPR